MITAHCRLPRRASLNRKNGSNRFAPLAGLVALALLAGVANAAPPPRAVAPSEGESPRSSSTVSACPVFHWLPIAGAKGYELALYALAPQDAPRGSKADPSSGEAVLRVGLPATASTWTPPRAWCLTPGQSYAWAVRAEVPGLATEWSDPALFRVGAREPSARVADAVATLRDLVGSGEARSLVRELLAGASFETAPRPGSRPGAAATESVRASADTLSGDRPRSLAPAGSSGGPVALGPYFLGTTADQDFELRVDGQAALVLQSTGGTPNLLAGYSGNSIGAGVVGGVIAGGGSSASFSQNAVTDDYGTVSGGLGNVAGNGTLVTADRPYATVGGGLGNQATGAGSTVGGGEYDYAQGSSATVAGGTASVASASAATVGGGGNNHATAARATVPGGWDGVAAVTGQLAYSAGGFDPATGDSQWSLYVPRAATTDSTPTDLLLNGTDRLTVEDGRTLAFEIEVAALSDGGQSAGYRVTGLIENVGGTTAFVGTPVVTVLGEDDASWDLAVAADDVNDALEIKATGAAATNVRWVAAVRSAEVKF